MSDEVTDVPEGVWRLSLTLTTADGRRFRARRIVGRTAAENVGMSVTEHTVIGNTARTAAWHLLKKSEAVKP